MSTSWSKPERDENDPRGNPVMLAANLQRRFHQPLHDAEVRTLILFARNEDGPALKRGGYPAAAIVRVLPLKWRVVTGCDALIELDQRVWEEADRDRRAAIIDHELSHLQPVEKEVDGGRTVLARDDIGRPKLTIKDGDFFAGDGFVEVIERHGEAALEVANVTAAHKVAMEALDQALAGSK